MSRRPVGSVRTPSTPRSSGLLVSSTAGLDLGLQKTRRLSRGERAVSMSLGSFGQLCVNDQPLGRRVLGIGGPEFRIYADNPTGHVEFHSVPALIPVCRRTLERTTSSVLRNCSVASCPRRSHASTEKRRILRDRRSAIRKKLETDEIPAYARASKTWNGPPWPVNKEVPPPQTS